MKILVTGAAGFIGSHVSHLLIGRGHEVVGLDNMNEYYDVTLKQARLARLEKLPAFRFVKLDLADNAELKHEYGLRVIRDLKPRRYDVAIVAVAHKAFRELGAEGLRKLCKKTHVLYDIKQVYPASQVDGRL